MSSLANVLKLIDKFEEAVEKMAMLNEDSAPKELVKALNESKAAKERLVAAVKALSK